MPENNETQYELDENYEPLGIVDAADGSGTTWPEFIEQVNKMDNQVAALTSNAKDQTPLIGETTSSSWTTIGSADAVDGYRLIMVVGFFDISPITSILAPPSILKQGGILRAQAQSSNPSGMTSVYAEARIDSGNLQIRTVGISMTHLYGIK